jgi:hypothetical protein
VGLLGRDTLIRLDRHDDPATARKGLSALLRSGHKSLLARAARRLVDDGPAAAVAELAATVRLDATTRTTAAASLALLQAAAPVLDEQTADRTVAWAVQTLRDPASLETRVQPNFLRREIVNLLAAALSSASHGSHLVAAATALDLPPIPEQALAGSWGNVVRAIDSRIWVSHAAPAAAAAARHHDQLCDPLLGVAATHVETARADLLARVAKAQRSALAAWGHVRSLPEPAAERLRIRLTQHRYKPVRTAATAADPGSTAPTIALPSPHVAEMGNTQHDQAR